MKSSSWVFCYLQLKHPYQYNTDIFLKFLLLVLSVFLILLLSVELCYPLITLSGDGSEEPQIPPILWWLSNLYLQHWHIYPCFKLIYPLLLDAFSELLIGASNIPCTKPNSLSFFYFLFFWRACMRRGGSRGKRIKGRGEDERES